jgi:hypothetical protein
MVFLNRRDVPSLTHWHLGRPYFIQNGKQNATLGSLQEPPRYSPHLWAGPRSDRALRAVCPPGTRGDCFLQGRGPPGSDAIDGSGATSGPSEDGESWRWRIVRLNVASHPSLVASPVRTADATKDVADGAGCGSKPMMGAGTAHARRAPGCAPPPLSAVLLAAAAGGYAAQPPRQCRSWHWRRRRRNSSGPRGSDRRAVG